MRILTIITVSLLAGTLPAAAQFNFNSGSTGSDGPLNITISTNMNLPTNGIFNFTTINVAARTTLQFNRNAANTPVYLLAQGDVIIAGTIDVSGENAPSGETKVGGKGGAGGFDGGFPELNGLPASDGYGPGGGKHGGFGFDINCDMRQPTGVGAGAYATSFTFGASTNQGKPYGSPLLVPLIGGSGGGGLTGSVGLGGGGGGGAILIASNRRIDLTGLIQANGGDGFAPPCGNNFYHINCGSGGAIRLVAPVVTGIGALRATGFRAMSGNHLYPNNPGRIRIDSIDRRNIPTDIIPAAVIGGYMVTLPPSRLDIIRVGDTNIPVGSGPMAIQLETDSDPNRTVTVQASNFNASVTCVLALTPESGPRSLYTNVINNLGTNTVTTSDFNVRLPVNTIVTINAWTQ